MAKKTTNTTKDTKNTTTKVMTPEEMTKIILGLTAKVAELDKALVLSQAKVAELDSLVAKLISAPTQEKKSTKSKKSTSTKDSKPRKPAPTKEEWLAFKAANADKVAHLQTRHERNSALYKLYMAA